MRRSMSLLAAASAVGLTAALAVAGQANAAPTRKLAGSVPSWANAASFRAHAASSDHVGFRVYLGWRGGDAAAQLATAVSTPGSPQYHRFLAPQQFRAQFAPTQSDVTAVQQWLHDQGFTVDYTPANNHYVQAEGSVAQAEAAFGTTINLYSVQGKTLRAPATDLGVPATLPMVESVVGLDESAALVHPTAPPAPVFVNARPCSDFFGQKTTADTPTLDGTVVPGIDGKPLPYAPCGYVASQLRGAYGVADAVASGIDGTGQTVAVIDAYASPTIVEDVNTYSQRHGLPVMSASQFRQVVAPGTFRHPEAGIIQDPQGWYGEETLDIEAVHSIAPGANIVYVGSANNFNDLDAALNHVVDRHLASIVTNSYGFSGEALPPGNIKPYNDIFIQAAATGIGVYFSSGDAGDQTGGNPANFDQATPDWPASSPWVTAVGGTSLAVGEHNEYLFETSWETGRAVLRNGVYTPTPPGVYTGGSGGGTSRLFPQPAYQAGVVPDSIATVHGGAPMRVVPDIAALGDPNTGFLVGQTQTFPDGSTAYSEFRIGGTSLSSPLMAGFMALVQQKGGHDLGFANPLIYSKAGSAAYHDIVPQAQQRYVARADFANFVDDSQGFVYSARALDFDTLTIHTRVGYDDITGVGSPNGEAFLAALSG
jgi:subtilase family serine protease